MFGSKKIQIACVGNIATDIFMTTKEYEVLDTPENLTKQKLLGFEYGAKVPIETTMLSYGGGGVNSAMNFAQLGERVGLFAAVGDDIFGRDFISYATHHQIETSQIHVLENSMTAVSSIIAAEDTREHVAFVYRGANTNYAVTVAELQAVQPEWIYLTSIAEQMTDEVLKVVFEYKKIHADMVNIFWNPGAAQLARGCRELEMYLSLVDVLQVNRDEALELLCMSDNNASMAELSRQLQAKGPKIALVTCSQEGAFVYDGEAEYHTPALSVEIADTTGAGDAFGSTFVAWYRQTKDIPQSLKAAAIQSAAVIAKPGAHQGLLSKQEIVDRIQEV